MTLFTVSSVLYSLTATFTPLGARERLRPSLRPVWGFRMVADGEGIEMPLVDVEGEKAESCREDWEEKSE